MRDAGRRLGGAPRSAAPIASLLKVEPARPWLRDPRIAAFVWGSWGPAHQPGSCTSWCELRLYPQLSKQT